MKKILAVFGMILVVGFSCQSFADQDEKTDGDDEQSVAVVQVDESENGDAAADEEAGKEKEVVSIETTIHISSLFVEEYTGEVTKKGLVSPDVVITHNPTGIYIQPKFYMTDRMEEVDLCVGKSFEVIGITLDAGLGYYLLPGDEDYLAAYLGAEFPEIGGGFVPFAYVESVFTVNGDTGNGGVLWNLGLKNSFKTFEHKFGYKIMLGGNDGVYGTAPKAISFVRGTISTEIELFGTKFPPFVSLQKGTSGADNIAGDEISIYVGIDVKF
jgi:hypothetical protein